MIESIEVKSFNGVFGSRHAARIYSQLLAPEAQFAGRCKAQAHCLRSGGLAPSITAACE
jgi:hypothetical protein